MPYTKTNTIIKMNIQYATDYQQDIHEKVVRCILQAIEAKIKEAHKKNKIKIQITSKPI